MKSILFIFLCLFSISEVHANRLILITKVLSEEVVKRNFNGKENPKLKPFRLEQSNACGIQLTNKLIWTKKLGSAHTSLILARYVGIIFQKE